MIQIKEEKIAELMFDIWYKSNDLKNPVMVGEYITEELTKVKNLAISGVVGQSEQLKAFAEMVANDDFAYLKDAETLLKDFESL